MNGHYIRGLDPEDLAERLLPFLAESSGPTGRERCARNPALPVLVPLIQERLKTLAEAGALVDFAFVDEISYDPTMLVAKGLDAARSLPALEAAHACWPSCPSPRRDGAAAARPGRPAGPEGRAAVRHPARGPTGKDVAPPLFGSILALGREATLARLAQAEAHLRDLAAASASTGANRGVGPDMASGGSGIGRAGEGSNAPMVAVEGQDIHALVAPALVSRRSYVTYLHASGREVPPQLARLGAGPGSVTWVSQVDAAAYCSWLGAREGQPYRLPGIGELVEFYSDAASEGVTPGIWQADAERNPPDCVAHDSCFSEWTRETLEEPVYGTGIVRVLGSIFYPPWLREGANASHIQAHMLASEGYSFISFRIARDAGRG